MKTQTDLFNWYSLLARLKNRYKALIYKTKKEEKVEKHEGKLISQKWKVSIYYRLTEVMPKSLEVSP